MKNKISDNDITFLLSLGDSDTAEITKYEVAEMYGVSRKKMELMLKERISSFERKRSSFKSRKHALNKAAGVVVPEKVVSNLDGYLVKSRDKTANIINIPNYMITKHFPNFR